MTKQYELLPCSVCGGEAEITERTQRTAFEEIHIVVAQCKRCGNRTYGIRIDAAYCANEEAAKVWNKRCDGVNKEKEETKRQATNL